MKLHRIKRKWNRLIHKRLTGKTPTITWPRNTMLEEGYLSQYGQDKYINEQVFHGKTGGFFVDIGANDGLKFSNSHFFETRLDWKGIAIEPLPSAFKRLKENRRCRCVQCCVGNSEREVEFLAIEGHSEMLSGVVEKYERAHLDRIRKSTEKHGDTATTIRVPSRQLSDILGGGNNSSVDFLSLDTEGGELEILKSIDFSRIRVTAISVENNYDDPEIFKLLKSKGYRLKAIVGDEIYVLESHS